MKTGVNITLQRSLLNNTIHFARIIVNYRYDLYALSCLTHASCRDDNSFNSEANNHVSPVTIVYNFICCLFSSRMDFPGTFAAIISQREVLIIRKDRQCNAHSIDNITKL